VFSVSTGRVAASQIEKKLHANLIILIVIIYSMVTVGAASSRDQAMMAKERFLRGWKPLPKEINIYETGCFV
jgi:hypothetical protein